MTRISRSFKQKKMAQISESHATLRIIGDELIPDEVTKLLECEPSFAQYKGQEIIAPQSGRTRISKFGMWRLRSEKRQPEDLDGQIADLLKQLTPDLGVWSELASRFSVELFVGLMMQETNEGCLISSSSLQELGVRRILLSLDVYAPVND